MSELVVPSISEERASATPPDHRIPSQSDELRLRHAAKQFESVFLAEMLRHTGLGEMSESFNGGPGEAAFSGFLLEAYAEQIADTRSMGLSDQIYRAMLRREAE